MSTNEKIDLTKESTKGDTKNNQQDSNIIKLTIDLGNSNYKLIIGDKRIKDVSNVQKVTEGTFGAFEINKGANKGFYLFGENAKSKTSTNKICPSKEALLGRALYSVVPNDAKVAVTTLLPLSLYINPENKKEFQNLLKGRYTVINQNGAKKTFTVASVEVCCESFSSLVTDDSLLKEPLYLVDLGGVDLSGVYVNRTPDINKMFTDEKGMNILHRQLATRITSMVREKYTDKDAKILLDKYDSLDDTYKNIIDEFMHEYIEENIYKPLKEIGYKEMLHKLVFVGGGSKDLERYLTKDKNVSILKDSIFSNAEGAKLISKRRGK